MDGRWAPRVSADVRVVREFAYAHEHLVKEGLLAARRQRLLAIDVYVGTHETAERGAQLLGRGHRDVLALQDAHYRQWIRHCRGRLCCAAASSYHARVHVEEERR
eukprot:878190-Pleurochrysis_carterae.AAC.1